MTATKPEAGTAPATHQVALSFEDGVTRFITCREDQTVADASYRQRINIPLDCRDGACGTCKAFCDSGAYEHNAYIDDALSESESADGYVLPCQLRPLSDLALQIASTSEVAKTQAATFHATVVGIERLSPTTMELAVEVPNRGDLAFLPGQYVNVAVPGTEVTRSYSFSNAPHEERLTFLVKLTPGGAMSTWLEERAEVGDELSFTGPHGSFFLRETERPVLLLAGGTGLAPILSMLRTMRAAASTRPAHLVYGVSTDDDIAKLDEIDELATSLPSLTWDYCVADPATSAPNRGYVTSLFGAEHLYDGDVAIYLCGPPPMVEAVRESISETGIEPTGFYYEKFALAAPAGSEAAPAPTVAPAPQQPYDEEELIPHEDGRSLAGQVMLMPVPDPAPPMVAAHEPAEASEIPSPHVAADGYQIGEEHPDVTESDAIFEARAALELGALELTLGRLSSQQLVGYRLLAEATLPYVDTEAARLIDAPAYTETNATFHDHLFALTGNNHLLEAYQALGIKARMAEVLRDATWCHPKCAQEHVDLVEAFEQGDRTRARALIAEHAEHSKQAMRRAMADRREATQPRFITPGRFAGQVVVVTGAAQGIGEAVAHRVAAEGGTVVAVDRSDLVGDLVRDITASGGRATSMLADLERAEGSETVVGETLSRYGRIDVLINNVGGAINFKPYVEFTPAEIDAEITRSLMTTMYACRAALPAMVAAGSGVIVNVSSAATRGVYRIPYSAAKGAVNALTASLAMEYADAGIRVVATAPGGTDAPPRRISRGTPEPANDVERAWGQVHVEQTLASSLMHRYGTLDEQAAAICFLASAEASYITGTILPVAGGDLG